MKKKTAKKEFSFRGYINCSLRKEHRKDFVRWTESSNIAELTDKLLSEGAYKLSVYYDTYNQAMCASLTCTNPPESQKSNAGYVLTARASSYQEAWALVVYKHFVILEEDWAKEAPDPSDNWG